MNLTQYAGESASACDSFYWPISGETYSWSGVYTDTLQGSNGCDRIIELSLTMIEIDTSVTQQFDTLFANESNATYQWFRCDSNMSIMLGDTFQQFTDSAGGLFAVALNKIGCLDTSQCQFVMPTGIDNSSRVSLKVYPNPFNDGIWISSSFLPLPHQFQLFDMAGLLVMTVDVEQNKLWLPLDQLASGIYFLHCNEASGPIAPIKMIKL